jgi:hypothetical protein
VEEAEKGPLDKLTYDEIKARMPPEDLLKIHSKKLIRVRLVVISAIVEILVSNSGHFIRSEHDHEHDQEHSMHLSHMSDHSKLMIGDFSVGLVLAIMFLVSVMK